MAGHVRGLPRVPTVGERVDVRRVALVVNPTSGKDRGARVGVRARRRLEGRGVEVVETSGPDGPAAATRLARAVEQGVDAVVAVGGDGLLQLALQAVAGTDVPLGLVPAGTGNDFAASAAVPLDPDRAVDAACDGHVRAVDACRATWTDDDGAARQRWWGCVLSAGFDSLVNERANRMTWPRGPRRYDLATLAQLRTLAPLPFRLQVDDEHVDADVLFVAVGNARSYGAGMRITPAAQVDDGLLDVTVVLPASRRTLLRLFPLVYSGRHVDHPLVRTYRGRRVELNGPAPVYADGERLADPPVATEVVPGALRLLTPSAG